MLALFSKLLQDPPKEKLRWLDRLFAGPSGRFAPAPIALRALVFLPLGSHKIQSLWVQLYALDLSEVRRAARRGRVVSTTQVAAAQLPPR